MRNQPNSSINKISDLNSEVAKINKKLSTIESALDKINSNIKEELTQRENIERKIFQMNEGFNNRVQSLQKGIDQVNNELKESGNIITNKLNEQFGNNYKNINKILSEINERIENFEENTEKSQTLIKNVKSEFIEKINYLDDYINKTTNIIKKEVANSLSKSELIEKKVQDHLDFQNKEFQTIIQDNNFFKNSIDSLLKFKENTNFNFTDLNEEINRIDEFINDLKRKVLLTLQENDIKIRNFEQNLTSETEKIIATKKDLYSQIYDFNLSINSKFDAINENVLEKFENYEKLFKNFKVGLIEENEKFSQYVLEQNDNLHLNTKKLLEYQAEELKLLSEKSLNLEDLIKSVRNEFYNSMNQLENSSNKKYENLLKSINSTKVNQYRYD